MSHDPRSYLGYAGGYAANPRSYLGYAVTRAPMHVRARVCVRACAPAHITRTARNRVTHVTTRVSRVTVPATHVTVRGCTRARAFLFSLPLEEKDGFVGEVKKGAELMPDTAAIVADLRLMLGAERVDRAIAAGQQARREFRRLEALHGLAHAQAWARAQKWPNGRFWAAEGGLEVGVRRC